MTDPSTLILPWRRDPDHLALRLAEWSQEEGRGHVGDVRTPSSGRANDTLMLNLDGEPVVIRLAPTSNSFPLFKTYDLELQRQVMKLVDASTPVPVPRVLHFEQSALWLGAPFLIMEAIEGAVPADHPPYTVEGWLFDSSLGEQARLEAATIKVLTDLHRIGDEHDNLTFLRPQADADTPLGRQLAAQQVYYEWARENTRVPVIERAFDVLSAAVPSTPRSVLNWGDSRIGNVIYRDFEPVAVLDWEMATVGPPEVDVGYLTLTHALYQQRATNVFGSSGLPALLQRDRVVSAYQDLAGHQLLDLAWFEAFAALRLAIINLRVSRRYIAFGERQAPSDPDDLTLMNTVLRELLAAI